MATYASLQDIIKTISEARAIDVSDDDKNGQLDDDVIENSINMAESEVNAALFKAGYTVPVVVPLPAGSEIIKTITVWLSICMLFARRGEIPVEYLDTCRYYREMLTSIADGDIILPLPASSNSNPRSNTEGQEPIFTRSKFETSSGEVKNPDEGHSLDTV
jgi:phage gp36-like protein